MTVNSIPFLSDDVDGGRDVIAFGSDITPEDLVFARDGDDMVLTVPGKAGEPDDKVTIIDWVSRPVELLTFSNGTILDINNAEVRTLTAGIDSHTIDYGDRDTPVILQAGAGNDVITGGGGKDDYGHYVGNKGNDIIFGQDGNDWIEAGEGYTVTVSSLTRLRRALP
ncbi:MAG: hypothetical protein GY798_25110 [Hyphomicrobiales bacterium]|nr:hypothetical protein [Hyphomicrobiales bacterium]